MASNIVEVESYFKCRFGEPFAEPWDGGRQDALVGGRKAVVTLSLRLEESAIGVNRPQVGSPEGHIMRLAFVREREGKIMEKGQEYITITTPLSLPGPCCQT